MFILWFIPHMVLSSLVRSLITAAYFIYRQHTSSVGRWQATYIPWYVSGSSIYKILQEYGHLGEVAIRSYSKQILAWLLYLHAKNTIHRWDFIVIIFCLVLKILAFVYHSTLISSGLGGLSTTKRSILGIWGLVEVMSRS